MSYVSQVAFSFGVQDVLKVLNGVCVCRVVNVDELVEKAACVVLGMPAAIDENVER